MSHYILLIQVSTIFSLPGGQQIPAKGRVQTLIGSQCRTRLVLLIFMRKCQIQGDENLNIQVGNVSCYCIF